MLRVLSVIVIAITPLLNGCAAFYHPANDQAAQAAAKSFNDAALGHSLEAERALLLKHQADRQNLVKRSQLALRDATLALVLDGGSPEYTWGFLRSASENRMVALRGKPQALPAGCHPTLKDARRFEMTEAEKAAIGAAQIALFTAGKADKVAPSCKSLPTAIAAGSGPGYAGLVAGYDAQCRVVIQAQACVAALEGNGGEIGALAAQVAAMTEKKAAIAQQLKSIKNQVADLIAQADAAKGTEGAAADVAAQIAALISRMEKTVPSDEDLAKVPALSRLADDGRMAALEQKKEILDSYLLALKGTAGTAPSLPVHRTQLVSALVNRATAQAPPPTVGIMMQADFYRQQIAAAQLRSVRSDEAIRILQRRRDALVAELSYLQETLTYLDAAKAACDVKSPFFNSLASGSLKQCSNTAARALMAFTASWTLGRAPAEQASYMLIDQDELAALDESETALRQSEAVLRVAFDEVAKRHAAGIKTEDIASLWQALGITAIAVRVK